MRRHTLITISFIALFSNLVISQAKIKIEKNTCCDNLGVMLGIIRHGDTVSYKSLLNSHGLHMMFLNCSYNSKAVVQSFELETIDDKKIINGNQIDLNTLKKFENGRTFIIKRCIINCTDGEGETKTVILPDRPIVIKP